MILNLPSYSVRTRTHQGQTQLWDTLRHKWILRTPEEWVRQHFVHHLIEDKLWPTGLMRNEIVLPLHGQRLRCDTILYNRDGAVMAIIEYKAPDVKISQSTFDQIYHYNLVAKARYLIVSNGIEHYICLIDYRTLTYQFLPAIPTYSEMTTPD